MSIRTAWKALMSGVESIAVLRTAELKNGLTLIEAAALDTARVELAMVVGRINVDTYLNGAVEMAKLGIWPDELELMARLYRRAQMVGLDNNETLVRVLKAEGKR